MEGKVTNERAPGTFTLIPLSIFIAVSIMGCWITTQWLAHILAYQSELGEPVIRLFSWKIFSPWKVFEWNYFYHAYAPDIFKRSMIYVFASVIASVISVILYAVWVARRVKIATTYGSARWAKFEEFETAGLMNNKSGVVLGAAPDGSYLIDNSDRNVELVAPPRTGKGVGLIIPTLLTYPNSVVVNDIKKEIWDATSGIRSQFSHVIYFNPTDPKSAHFNPLFEIRKGPEAIGDAQNIADMIVDPDGTGKPDHWDKTSHALLVAAILHVMYAEPNKTLPGLATFLADPNRDILTTLSRMLSTPHEDPRIHSAIASAARENLNRSPNELSGVMSTAMSFLGLYRDPIIADNLADSDFRIMDLLNNDKPVSLYLVIPPSDINRTKPLRRLIWAQIGRRFTQELNPVTKKNKVLLVVDEFPALGRMDFFETQLAFTSGYGVKTLLVSQSRNQKDKIYGPSNSISGMCDIKVYFTPNEDKTAETISTMTGTKTEVHQQKTYTGHRFSPWLPHVMVADQEVGRPLLTPGEVLTFPESEALLFMSSKNPMRIRKVRYYDDPNFKRLLKPAPVLTQTRPYPFRISSSLSEWQSSNSNAGTLSQRNNIESDSENNLSPTLKNSQEITEPQQANYFYQTLNEELNTLAMENYSANEYSNEVIKQAAFDVELDNKKSKALERNDDEFMDRAI